jgi:hypothetical protein
MSVAALLDHPWPLEEALDRASPGFDILRQFVDLQREYGLQVVPFISENELSEMWERLPPDAFRRNPTAYRALLSFSGRCVRTSSRSCRATPIPGPTDLRASWQYGLYDSAIAGDWRTPQIIVPRDRLRDWGADHVQVNCEQCGDEDARSAGMRLVIEMQSYGLHAYARSDFDPWDMERTAPPQPGGPQHPCRLPRPPALVGVQFAALSAAAQALHGRNWCMGENYYFVPPEDWRAENVGDVAWRNGRAFPHAQSQFNPRSGYVDDGGRVWVWDGNERHWDVQLDQGEYIRVSHTGQALRLRHFSR